MPKPKLNYVFDPLCGWCYAFSPVVEAVAEKYRDSFDIAVTAGGMIVNEDRPISQMRDYIKEVLPRLTAMTGAVFGEAFLKDILEDGRYMLDSVPSSIAFVVLKELLPDEQTTIAGDIQRAHFRDGKSLNATETLTGIATLHGAGESDFLTRFSGEEYRQKTFAEFEAARGLGVTGFPTLLLENEGQTEVLARGYSTFEKIARVLDGVRPG